MAGKKEIRSKILSVKNTQKITRAMEMVAASKMRRTQERLKAARPYAASMERIIFHVAQATPEYRHPYMEKREGNRVGILVIGTDRGLCGGLNVNLFRKVFRRAKEFSAADGGAVHWALLGKKAVSFFGHVGADVVAKTEGLGEVPTLKQIRGVVLSLVELYKEGKIDSLWVASNKFVNTLVQKPTMERLLPLFHQRLQGLEHEDAPADSLIDRDVSWDYLYEPEPKDVIDALLERYIEAFVFHALVENGASEMAAKMVAMKNASENAGRIVKELQIAYNKARQAAITQEIAEIVAGAAAV